MTPELECAVWEITLACNMNCSHCGSSAGSARPDELTTQECFDLCEQLAGLGCGTVALMGGEPFIREDWFAIGQCVRDLGMDVSIVSNGWDLAHHMDELGRLEPKVVGLSLDGLQATHDVIRTPGSFARVMEAVRLLRDQSVQTTLITTVSMLNFRDLPSLGELIPGTGANWQLQIAMPFGNFRREQMISPEEYYALGMFIATQRIRHPFHEMPVVGAHCFGYYSDVLPGSRRWTGCTAGMTSIGIPSDGGIVGCLSMGNDRFMEGNIRERSLADIWNHPSSFAYNRRFSTRDLEGECRSCAHGPACRGGCNSVSFNLTGTFHGDPYCFRTLERTL